MMCISLKRDYKDLNMRRTSYVDVQMVGLIILWTF